jgi:hypothetical protein
MANSWMTITVDSCHQQRSDSHLVTLPDVGIFFAPAGRRSVATGGAKLHSWVTPVGFSLPATFIFNVRQPSELLIPFATDELEYARLLESLTRRKSTSGLFATTEVIQVFQTARAAKRVGFQFLGNAVAPCGGDFEIGQVRTARAATGDGVGWHRHRGHQCDQSNSKGMGSPLIWARAFIAARCSASFLLRPQAPA